MNRIKLLAALGMAIAALANQSCNRSGPAQGADTAAGQSLTTAGTVAGLSLRVDLYPTALPGQPFNVDVSFRNSSGQLMNVADNVTLKLSTNPTGGTLGGTLTRGSVAGVASFPDLFLDNVGQGYVITASSVQAGTATSAAFAIAFSEDEDKAPSPSAGTSPSTARPISPLVPKFRTLGAGEVHYYQFRGKAGQLLTAQSYANRIDMRNWDTSLRLRLIAPDGVTEIARAGAAGPGQRGVDNAIATLRLPQDGTYSLAVDVDQAGFLSGVYALVIALAPNPGVLMQKEAEAWGVTGQNDTIATAQQLLPGMLYGHYDNAAGGAPTSDFYKIALLVPSRVRIDLQAARNGMAYGDALSDLRLELQTSTGAVLWSNDNSYGNDPVIDYIVNSPGTYYVRVTSNGGGSAPYFLSYVPVPYVALAETAGNTSMTTATPMKFGVDYTGSFSAPGDHYFAFGGTAGDLVRVVVEGQTQLQSGTLTLSPVSATGDAVLLGPDGSLLASGASYSVPGESRLNLRQAILPSTGTWFVRVRSAVAGKFGLRVERIAGTAREVEPNDTVAQATPVPAGGWISGAISSPGDKDHFLVGASSGQLVTISLLGAAGTGLGSPLADWGSGLMPNVEVRNLSGDLLAVAGADRRGEQNYAESLQHPLVSAIGGGLPMLQVSFHAPASANYDVVVSDADGQGDPSYSYALFVWRNQ
ncbi:MAG TPA: PPC domain-containing protein [Myxococcales bacterium]